MSKPNIQNLYEFDKGEGGYVDNYKPFPLGEGLSSKVILSRQPLLVGTVEEAVANGGVFDPVMMEQGSGVTSQSWLGVPIIINDRVIGLVILTITGKTPSTTTICACCRRFHPIWV